MSLTEIKQVERTFPKVVNIETGDTIKIDYPYLDFSDPVPEQDPEPPRMGEDLFRETYRNIEKIFPELETEIDLFPVRMIRIDRIKHQSSYEYSIYRHAAKRTRSKYGTPELFWKIFIEKAKAKTKIARSNVYLRESVDGLKVFIANYKNKGKIYQLVVDEFSKFREYLLDVFLYITSCGKQLEWNNWIDADSSIIYKDNLVYIKTSDDPMGTALKICAENMSRSQKFQTVQYEILHG